MRSCGLLLVFFLYAAGSVGQVRAQSFRGMEKLAGDGKAQENEPEAEQSNPYSSAAEQPEEDFFDSYCDELYDELGIGRVDQELYALGKRYGQQDNLSFSEITRLLMEGRVDEAFGEAMEGMGQKLMGELLVNRELLVRLFLLVVLASLFHNYSSVLKSGFAGEQGFYVTYLMIAALLIQSFTLAYDVAEHAVTSLHEIMNCMLPAFYLSIVLVGGLSTSQMVSSLFIGMLSFVERLLLELVLPGIRIYFLIMLMNQIGEKDRFSKLAGLLRQGIGLVLKTMVTGIVGLNLMKSLLVPVYESARYGLLQKGLSALPGGSSLSGLSTLLLGAGVLLKNSVGITVVVLLLVFTGVPILKLFGFSLLYRILLALIQPVSDKRIMAGIQGAAESIEILLRAVATAVVLFILSVAIVIMTTNVRLYIS